MRQRAAIARALALGSPLLLMDEPFGALDPVNRARLQDLLLEVWEVATPRKTIVFVTHDVDEAIYLGDRLIVLGSSPGRVIADLQVPLPRPRERRSCSTATACMRCGNRWRRRWCRIPWSGSKPPEARPLQ
jgi:NitT/TauT family transport system ATP-binding protein